VGTGPAFEGVIAFEGSNINMQNADHPVFCITLDATPGLAALRPLCEMT
jgi:hypothetical protein